MSNDKRKTILGLLAGILGGITLGSMMWASKWILAHAGLILLFLTGLNELGFPIPRPVHIAVYALILATIAVTAWTKWIPQWRENL